MLCDMKQFEILQKKTKKTQLLLYDTVTIAVTETLIFTFELR